MRLYYGRLLRAIEYRPALGEHPAKFTVHLRPDARHVLYHEAPSLEALLTLLKSEGHQIWGKDVLDYALPPKTAFEYILCEDRLKAQGLTDAEIAELFSLNHTSIDKTE